MIQCEVYKERSNASCLRAAFDLICTNFMLFLRKTWLSALVFSVLSALLLVFNDSLIAIIPVVGTIVAMCLLYACCLGEVVEQSRGSLFLRFLKVYALNIVVVLLFELLAVFIVVLVNKLSGKPTETASVQSLLPYALIAVGVLIAMIVALVPTSFSSIKYVVEPQTKLRIVFGSAYKDGWRSWGYLFVVGFLVFLIAAIVLGLAYLPIIVLASAKRINDVGVMLGDASALPTNFSLMLFCAGVIASFINAYVMMWMLLTWYHAYGRIETRRREKEKATQN